jgi:pyrroloquinoline quinone biosynthesis protein D
MSPILPGQFPKLSARARVQKDKVTGEPVVLYPEGVLMLNPTGHAIVTLCTGGNTLHEIVAKLAAQYQVSTEQVQADVVTYLDRLRARNLLEVLNEKI